MMKCVRNGLTEVEEETNDITDNETDLPTRAEDRTTRDFVATAVVAIDQRALGEDEVEGKDGQREGGEEAQPDENRVGLDHAPVSDHRANESAERSCRE
jgi:hypothetical protein